MINNIVCLTRTFPSLPSIVSTTCCVWRLERSHGSRSLLIRPALWLDRKRYRYWSDIKRSDLHRRKRYTECHKAKITAREVPLPSFIFLLSFLYTILDNILITLQAIKSRNTLECCEYAETGFIEHHLSAPHTLKVNCLWLN